MLAAGCTMVLKPASQTPFFRAGAGGTGQRAGIPAGVFNVVTGSAGDIGGELTQRNPHRYAPTIRLHRLPTEEIGRQLMEQCAPKDIKKCRWSWAMRRFIVFDDADLDKRPSALASKFRNAGQTCVCANRLAPCSGRRLHDRFAEKPGGKISSRSATACKPTSLSGRLLLIDDEKPWRDRGAYRRRLLEKGARVITGGEAHKLGGNFFQPTIHGG